MSVQTYNTHTIVTGWNSLPEEIFVRQGDYDAAVDRIAALEADIEQRKRIAVDHCKAEAAQFALIAKREAALRHIRDEAYGEFYVEGNGAALEKFCAAALGEAV